MQTRKVTHYPVVLVVASFWNPLREWMRTTLLDQDMISPGDVDRFHIVDTADEALDFIAEAAPGIRGHVGLRPRRLDAAVREGRRGRLAA